MSSKSSDKSPATSSTDLEYVVATKICLSVAVAVIGTGDTVKSILAVGLTVFRHQKLLQLGVNFRIPQIFEAIFSGS